MADEKFRYGQCRTDHKDGKTIRTRFRTADYVLGEAARPGVAAALAALGLPFPEEEEIFRGTRHDLLFIESHGVVVRIGPMAMDDLVHPALLQPLGWINDVSADDDGPIGIALYPGIEHYDRTMAEDGYGVDDLTTFMDQTGQNSGDVGWRNTGVIRISRDGSDVRVPVVLDIDNILTGANSRSSYRQQGTTDTQRRDKLPSAAIQDALTSVSPIVKLGEDLVAAFAVHQPLRHMFWRAWRDESGAPIASPDKAQMAAFWARCARLLQAPERAVLYDWEQHADAQGDPAWRADATLIENMSLYRAWTGVATDRVPKFTGRKAAWTKALESVARDPENLGRIDAVLAENPEFVRMAVWVNSQSAVFMAPHFRADITFIEKLNLSNLKKVGCMSDELRDDPDVLLPYIRKDEAVLTLASVRLRRDSAFLARCLDVNLCVGQYLPQAVEYDAAALKSYIEDKPEIYSLFEHQERLNPVIAMAAMERKGALLRSAPPLIQGNRDIVLAAIRDWPEAIRYASPELQQDKSLWLDALRGAPHVYQFLPDELTGSRAFRIEAAALKNVIREMSTEDRDDPVIAWTAVLENPEAIKDISFGLQGDADFMRSFLRCAPWKGPDLLYTLAADKDFVFDLVKTKILMPENLPEDLQNNIDFMVRVAKLPHIAPNDIPLEVACLAEFRRRMDSPELAPEAVVGLDENGMPVVERGGLRYVWAQNVHISNAEETGDGRVRLKSPHVLIVRDAVTGPAREGLSGLIGVYTLRG